MFCPNCYITETCLHGFFKLLNYMGMLAWFFQVFELHGDVGMFCQVVTLQRHVGMFLPRVFLLLPCKEIQILANLSPKFNKRR